MLRRAGSRRALGRQGVPGVRGSGNCGRHRSTLYNLRFVDSLGALEVNVALATEEGGTSRTGGNKMKEKYDLTIDYDHYDDDPYDLATFAEKHGLDVRAAELLLFAKGPSRVACDAAALAFLAAVAAQAKRHSAR
jgi:hypothetical protein